MKSAIAIVAFATLSGSAGAQAPAPAPAAPPAPRARGPVLAPAVRAAETAVQACAANGYKVSALITDSANDPVVLLSGDGVRLGTQTIAKAKASAVFRYKVSSGEVVKRMQADPALAAEVKADPKIGTLYQGGVPIMVGGEMIGAFAVSGAPGGDKDEACGPGCLAEIPAAIDLRPSRAECAPTGDPFEKMVRVVGLEPTLLAERDFEPF